MPSRRVGWLPLFVVSLGPGLPALGQSVISVRSGVVHYFEGAVSIAEQPLQRQAGRFPTIPAGAELRTAEGRAEVLLTPGVILRVAENSAIRMRSSDLSDTQVELLAGSAILESTEQHSGDSVMLIFKQWSVRVPRRAVYRIDSEPQQLTVYAGDTEVSTLDVGAAVKVKEGETLSLSAVLVPEKSASESANAFTDWSMGRSQVVLADNATAAQIVDDPALFASAGLGVSSGLGLGGFTYYPLVGMSSYPSAGISPFGLGSSSVYGWSSWTSYPYARYSPYPPNYLYRPSYPIRSGGVRYPTLPLFGSTPHAGSPVPHGSISPPPVHVPAPHPNVGHAGHR